MNANKSWSQRTNPTNAAGHRMCKEMLLLKKKIAAKHSTQCIVAVNRTNKRSVVLWY